MMSYFSNEIQLHPTLRDPTLNLSEFAGLSNFISKSLYARLTRNPSSSLPSCYIRTPNQLTLMAGDINPHWHK